MPYNFAMFTVVETDTFVRYAQAIWSDAERDDFITWIANNPLSGAVIPETGGLRKVRYARQGGALRAPGNGQARRRSRDLLQRIGRRQDMALDRLQQSKI